MRIAPAMAAGVTNRLWFLNYVLVGQVVVVECPARKLAGYFMRFTNRDVPWLSAVVVATLARWLGWALEIAMLRDENATLL